MSLIVITLCICLCCKFCCKKNDGEFIELVSKRAKKDSFRADSVNTQIKLKSIVANTRDDEKKSSTSSIRTSTEKSKTEDNKDLYSTMVTVTDPNTSDYGIPKEALPLRVSRQSNESGSGSEEDIPKGKIDDDLPLPAPPAPPVQGIFFFFSISFLNMNMMYLTFCFFNKS